MAAIQYIGLNSLILTYLQFAIIKSMCNQPSKIAYKLRDLLIEEL